MTLAVDASQAIDFGFAEKVSLPPYCTIRQHHHLIVSHSIAMAYSYSHVPILGYRKCVTPLQRAVIRPSSRCRTPFNYVATEIAKGVIVVGVFNDTKYVIGWSLESKLRLSGNVFRQQNNSNNEDCHIHCSVNSDHPNNSTPHRLWGPHRADREMQHDVKAGDHRKWIGDVRRLPERNPACGRCSALIDFRDLQYDGRVMMGRVGDRRRLG
jgi:hypothetical protein